MFHHVHMTARVLMSAAGFEQIKAFFSVIAASKVFLKSEQLTTELCVGTAALDGC